MNTLLYKMAEIFDILKNQIKVEWWMNEQVLLTRIKAEMDRKINIERFGKDTAKDKEESEEHNEMYRRA